jgi:hypothetical protein
MAEKPFRFRAVHAKNPWRKAAHETFKNATSSGNRSALALFEHGNDAINYAKEGEPLCVVVWHKDAREGQVLKHDPNATDGLRHSEPVPRSVIDGWEKQRGASDEELEHYFGSAHSPATASELTEPLVEDATLDGFKTIEQLNEHLSKAVAESATLSRETRLKRLDQATNNPQRVEVSTFAFIRNPDVIVEVLIRANGRCELCGSLAPFQRARDGSPYLEVHHIIPLSLGGEDTISNAQALCPNCHRYLHFGQMP